MTRVNRWVCLILALSFVSPGLGQQSPATPANGAVPPLVNFSGTLVDVNGKPLTGVVGVTFLLYKDEQGGAPLWLESQNVTPDKKGRYTVTLGATTSGGLPTDVFANGEARWLAVQVVGQAEQERVLLVAVPYALKAADAETVGGLPPSAFLLASPTMSGSTVGSANQSSAATSTANPLSTSSNVTTTGGTVNALPLWTTATNIQSSVVTQTGSGSSAKIGINTGTPAATLDVKGGTNIEGLLDLPATGIATSSGGKNSQAQGFVASSFNSSSSKAVNQSFQWQAEPAGNNTSTPSGTLNLLFGSGTSSPSETGLKISNKGLFTFATGQTFPGTGTITGVTAGTDLTGGGTGGNVTLNLDTSKVPLLNAANAFVGNQTITGNLSDTGNISATGLVSGQTASFTGNNNTQIISVTQQGIGQGFTATSKGGSAIQGSATNVTGPAVGVFGTSASSSGAGVLGHATATGSGGFGVNGTEASPTGVGVEGQAFSSTGGIGVEGVTIGAGGIGVHGSSTNTSGALAGLFDGPTLFNGLIGISSPVPQAPLDIMVPNTGTQNLLFLGDSSGGSGDVAKFTYTASSSPFPLTLNLTSNTAFARPFEIVGGNVGIGGSGTTAPLEQLDVAGRVRSQNLATAAVASNRTFASSNQCLGALTSANSNCDTPDMTLTATTGNVPVFIMANLNGVTICCGSDCVVANFGLVMDGQIIAASNIALGPPSSQGHLAETSVTMVSLQFPARGSHTFEVQESDDTGLCSGDSTRTTISNGSNTSSNFSTRTLIVREC